MYSINEIKRILEDSKQQSNINVKPISLFDEEAMKYKMQYDSHILESLFKRFDVSNVDDDTLDSITGKIHRVEHYTYPDVIKKILQGEIICGY